MNRKPSRLPKQARAPSEELDVTPEEMRAVIRRIARRDGYVSMVHWVVVHFDLSPAKAREVLYGEPTDSVDQIEHR